MKAEHNQHSNHGPQKLGLFDRLTFLLKDSVMYGVAYALSRSITLLMLPILTHHFSPTTYALIDIYLIVTSFLMVLYTFGQDAAASRLMVEDDNDAMHQKQIISESLLLRLLPAGVLSLCGLAGIFIAYHAELLSHEHAIIATLAAAQGLAMLVHNFGATICKMLFMRSAFILLTLGTTVSFLGGFAICLFGLNMGMHSVFVAGCLSYGGFALVSLYLLRHHLVICWPMRHMRALLMLATPFGVVSLFTAAALLFERGFIVALIGAESLGIYAAATRIALIMQMGVLAFQMAWHPFFLVLSKQDKADETYNQVLKLFVFASCVLVALLAVASYPLITLLMSEVYYSGVIVVLPLCLGFVLQGAGWITEIGIILSKRGHLQLYVNAGYLLATIGSVYLLGSLLGPRGVAYGMMLGFAVKMLLGALYAQRARPIAWQLRQVYSVLALLTLAVIIWSELHNMLPPMHVVYASLIAAPLLIALSALMLFSRQECQSLTARIRQRRLHKSA